MAKPILIPFCKTRSGKLLQVGPVSEWDRICEGFEDLDYIDLHCVYERLDLLQWRDELPVPAIEDDVGPLWGKVQDYFTSLPDLNLLLPPSLYRAKIAEELFQAASY